MSDRDLQEQVQNALDWEPSIEPAHIGVSVDGGVVTLRGDVRTYSEKTTAERVTLGIYGVKAVANDLTVRLGGGQKRTDTEIAQAVLSGTRTSRRSLTSALSPAFQSRRSKPSSCSRRGATTTFARSSRRWPARDFREAAPRLAFSQLRRKASQLSKVLLDGAADRGKARRGGGVAGDEVRSAIALDETSMSSTHGNLLVQDAETGRPPEQHDNPWVDDVDLLTDVDAAVSDVCGGRSASRPAVFDRTGEIDILFGEAHALDRTAEPLTRLSNKGSPRLGLVSAGRFADEDNLGVGAPLASDGLAGAPSLALAARLDLSRNLS
jgi:hypothetical protein